MLGMQKDVNNMKYKIGEVVKIKATGEKVKILGYWNDFSCKPCEKFVDVSFPYIVSSKDGECFGESELKPYRPNRTGKFRNSKGQFRSVDYGDIAKKGSAKLYTGLYKAAQEQRDHFVSVDSKQRNYQKILSKLDEIEKKIDELGRKI